MRWKASALRLGHELARGDVADVLEQVQHAELFGDALGVAARAVGEDELAAGQACDRGGQLGRFGHGRQIDVVHVVEEGLRVELVDLHQPRQRGAELAVVALLQVARLREGYAEIVGDELAHAPVDFGEEVARRRVERVVEIEDPG